MGKLNSSTGLAINERRETLVNLVASQKIKLLKKDGISSLLRRYPVLPT